MSTDQAVEQQDQEQTSPPEEQATPDPKIPDNLEEILEKARRFDEEQEKSKSELQKAQERAEQAERRAAEATQQALVADVATAKGVPAAALHGSSKADLEKAADELLAWADARARSKTPPRLTPPISTGSKTDKTSTTKQDAAAAAIRGLFGPR